MTHKIAIPLAIFGSLALGCGTEGTGFLVSDEQEAQLGAQVHDEVITEYPLVEDATVNAWVADLGGQIASASASERTGVTYRFHVLDADIINAFAAPGGYIYLTTGLILAAESEAEVAGVLGHEVGHVAHRHSVATLERAVAIGTVSDFFFGDGTFGDDAVAVVTNFVLGTSYSRDQESDADILGVDFTYSASINPFGIVSFFELLESLQQDSIVPGWLSSHPEPSDRIDNTSARIQQIHPGFSRDTAGFAYDVTGDFAQIQAVLGGGTSQ